jgi:hypothetical protein
MKKKSLIKNQIKADALINDSGVWYYSEFNFLHKIFNPSA